MQTNNNSFKSNNVYGASSKELKEAVKACFEKDPCRFMSMSGSSLWEAVNEEIARDVKQTVA